MPWAELGLFFKKMSLEEMVNHIYGRSNVIDRLDRPNFIVKELNLYIDHLKSKIEEAIILNAANSIKSLIGFSTHLLEGIQYYENLLQNQLELFKEGRELIYAAFELSKEKIKTLQMELMEVKV